ncbi:MAG: metal-dependent hydrolase [Candidatus Rokubacteria bacterium RIFCSPHIGHO2_12_FULL_73_22]|nr:MAG: metal-dependent hydrolase [Candidatus Rokubacteria bacterium RIFCSPHIGHO2_12_FULL_73_22]
MPVVDFHIHAYDWPISGPASFVEFMDREMARAYGSFAAFVERFTTGEAYERVLDDARVDYGVILAELAPITSAIASNETVARLCQGHPRLIPFASLNPYLSANPAQELERLVREHGFRGLKLYPTYNYFYPNDRLLYPLYAKAQELRIPVKWHTGTSAFPASRLKYGDPMHIDDVAVDFPDLVAIITHSGRPLWYDTAYTLARMREHVYMEIAGLPPRRLLDYFPDLERVSDKVLFGSDWPSVPTMKGNVEGLRALPLSAEAKERILGGNAARLLGLA